MSMKILGVPYNEADNLALQWLNEEKKMVDREKTEPVDKRNIIIIFSAPEDSIPVIEGLNFHATDWAIPEFTVNKDTVSFWIKDSMVYNIDTLKMTAGYYYTDTLNNLSFRTDTLNLFMRQKPKAPEKKKRKNDKDTVQIEYLSVNDQIPGTLDIGQKPRITFDEPIVDYKPEGLWLEMQQDSV